MKCFTFVLQSGKQDSSLVDECVSSAFGNAFFFIFHRLVIDA